MIFVSAPPQRDPLRAHITALARADETAVVDDLLAGERFSSTERHTTAGLARHLVVEVRAARKRAGGLDTFLYEYGLSSPEGVVLMCLAEALLRIPDAETANRLIRDKLAPAGWEAHLGQSDSVLVNASTWGLMLTGRVIRLDPDTVGNLGEFVARLVARSGEPLIRQALSRAMRILAGQFVMGRTIGESLERAHGETEWRYSFDMLGEAACTARDAERYFEAYLGAIAAIGDAAPSDAVAAARPGLSIKLSALHPRFELAQSGRVMAELTPRLRTLAREAGARGIGVCIDAEEADRLDLTLDLFAAVYGDGGELAGWDGLGIAVQAYQKRARAVIAWLAATSHNAGRRIPVRLVKGAYWDTEIKRAQERGLEDYPVFTRKVTTDVSYLVCARELFAAGSAVYPQFATHNAHTVAAVATLAGTRTDYEFQRLHGMGEALYEALSKRAGTATKCRVYAPVGSHEELLPYLVRRLLENGANTSFVNRIVDDAAAIDDLVADPADTLSRLETKPHPRIPPPTRLFGEDRRNSHGIDLSDPAALAALASDLRAVDEACVASPLIDGSPVAGADRPILDPSDNRREVGRVSEAGADAVAAALASATVAAEDWDRVSADHRAGVLEVAADLIESERARLMVLAIREAGKTIPDALAEVREAADFCRYYAARARIDFADAVALPGPTGEDNRISLHGRGAFVCISPWNFPLAIFTGQVSAALAAGNAVIAKPAEQTPLIAFAAVELLHRAGVPAEVLHLLPGGGESVGAPLVGDPRIAGVAFTGSTETARQINRSLAAREGPIVPLIAETGGQNAMIVDSSALPEQVTADVIQSAFLSAGQRCSALRVLFLQADVAEKILDMLAGAMAELVVGDPVLLATDVGPAIDHEAVATLEVHTRRMEKGGKLIAKTPLGPDTEHGSFFAPRAFEIASIDLLKREVFGPILHVVRYRAEDLETVCDAINRTGYGLTLGIHSRIDETASQINRLVRVGNTYVNRNMVGAVVGVQPFGGEGLSGSGPKAGGPRTLARFATERTLSVNTTATGGNAALMSLEDL